MLLDTCILIDILRRQASAVAFLNGLAAKPSFSVASLSELRAGQRGERDKRAVDELVATGILIDIDRPIAEIAGELLRRYQKSHALGLGDALIAATAIHHQLQLVTLNLKHFPMFPDLKRPY